MRVAAPDFVETLRGDSVDVAVRLSEAAVGSRRHEEVIRSLRPLGFGAAYKILDQLVEHVLRANGASPGKLPFTTKNATLATRPPKLPPPFDGRPELWDRLAALYVDLDQARHAVTHRRARSTDAGDLEIYDNEQQRQRIDTVTNTEIAAFAASVHVLTELVIGASSDERRLNIAAWSMNDLQQRHGLGPLAATDPSASRRLLVMDLEHLDDGLVRFDGPTAQTRVDGQDGPALWDLELHAGERVFSGRWEDVGDAHTAVDFHPDTPPGWLTETLAS